jgi:hypothetical protein
VGTGGFNVGVGGPTVGNEEAVSNSKWQFGITRGVEPGERRSLNVAHLMIYDRLLTSEEVARNRVAYRRRFPNLGLV